MLDFQVQREDIVIDLEETIENSSVSHIGERTKTIALATENNPAEYIHRFITRYRHTVP